MPNSPKYSLTLEFPSGEALADWLQVHTFPTGHSGVNVDRTTGEVNGGASASVDHSDPWGNYDSGSPASDVATAPSDNGPRVVHFDTQKGQQEWTFNSGNAPMCECGIPAAFQKGKTNNKEWSRWTCSRSAPDGTDNWKHKCDFSEFVGGRGKK